MKDNDFSVVIGEFGESLVDELRIDDLVFEGLVWREPVFEGEPWFFVFPLVVSAMVEGDSEDPGFEAGLGLESLDGLVHCDEDLLGDVLGG